MPNPEELLFKGDSKASIVNYGTINAWDGDVTFISYQIENHGTLNAPNGVVSLAAGQEVLLKPNGKQRIFIRASGNAKTEDDGIVNTGSIHAIQAELRAEGNPYAYAIKQDGLVEAIGTVERDGRIYLVAEDGMNVSAGTFIAKNANDTGGTMHLLGEKVGLVDEAYVDIGGKFGGGTLLMGGDYKGSNPDIYNAEYVFLDLTL